MTDQTEQLTIADLVDEAHTTAVDKGWWDRPRGVPEVLMLCVTELSEAMEEYRSTGLHAELAATPDGEPSAFAVELADCVIRIADLCGYLGIDLAAALAHKMCVNRGRQYRHGGKLA